MGYRHIVYVSGAVADLQKGHRTPKDVLVVLAEHPNVSTWDMDNTWLESAIDYLESIGFIIEIDDDSASVWHNYAVTPKGVEWLKYKDEPSKYAHGSN